MWFVAAKALNRPPLMRYTCSMVVFVDGGLSFSSLVFHHQFWDLSDQIAERFVGGIIRSYRYRSWASDLADGWKCRMRPAGMKRPLTVFTAFLRTFLARRQFFYRLHQQVNRRWPQLNVPSPLS